VTLGPYGFYWFELIGEQGGVADVPGADSGAGGAPAASGAPEVGGAPGAGGVA
jgi:hypothetical protein